MHNTQTVLRFQVRDAKAELAKKNSCLRKELVDTGAESKLARAICFLFYVMMCQTQSNCVRIDSTPQKEERKKFRNHMSNGGMGLSKQCLQYGVHTKL